MTGYDGGPRLPRQILDVLPAEPDALAALASQVASLALDRAASQHAAQVHDLQQAIAERDARTANLQAQMDDALRARDSLDRALRASQASVCQLEAEKLALTDSIRALLEKVKKLETFKKSLIASLRDDGPGDAAPAVESPSLPDPERFIQETLATVKAAQPGPGLPVADAATPVAETGSRAPPEVPGPLPSAPAAVRSFGDPLAPQLATPGSHTAPAGLGYRPHVQPPGALSATDGAAARGKVDGKDFFKLARSRLEYPGFTDFLQSIKDLNSGQQTRDETLERAKVIFGPNNSDLYVAFQGLLARHLAVQ